MSGDDSNIISKLEYWDSIVISHERDFEDVFCNNNELISVYWNSTHMKVVYIDSTGMHIGQTYKINEWVDFINKYPTIKTSCVEFLDTVYKDI